MKIATRVGLGLLLPAALGIALLTQTDLPFTGHDSGSGKERVTVTIDWQDYRSNLLITIYVGTVLEYNQHYQGRSPFVKSFVRSRNTSYSVSVYQYEAGRITCQFEVDGAKQEPFTRWDKGMLRCRRR